ncbi:hypothetical protein BGZ57DRAFT_862821 [Hyaloscypha finlandica]|nr:hypothetical protein BGZ57DRAFT_862821 [Hyaloscypha finlandica]
MSRTIARSLSYIVPEVWMSGNQTLKVDIYALGTTIVTLTNQYTPQIAPILTDIADQCPIARDLLDAFFPQPAHVLQGPRNARAQAQRVCQVYKVCRRKAEEKSQARWILTEYAVTIYRGTKANIVKPKGAFKIKKRPEGTGGTGIGNGLTSDGILADAATGYAKRVPKQIQVAGHEARVRARRQGDDTQLFCVVFKCSCMVHKDVFGFQPHWQIT